MKQEFLQRQAFFSPFTIILALRISLVFYFNRHESNLSTYDYKENTESDKEAQGSKVLFKVIKLMISVPLKKYRVIEWNWTVIKSCPADTLISIQNLKGSVLRLFMAKVGSSEIFKAASC